MCVCVYVCVCMYMFSFYYPTKLTCSVNFMFVTVSFKLFTFLESQSSFTNIKIALKNHVS